MKAGAEVAKPSVTKEWPEEELVRLYLDTDARDINLHKVLDYLMDRPGQAVTGKELATYLGVTGEQFRGVMGGPASRLQYEYKLWPPFRIKYDPEAQYTLPPREAETLRSIRLVLRVLKEVRLSLNVG